MYGARAVDAVDAVGGNSDDGAVGVRLGELDARYKIATRRSASAVHSHT